MRDYFYSISFNENGAPYISHHGIKGQKWGVQNGPPYPLEYDDYSKAEKKERSRSNNDSKSFGSSSVKEKDIESMFSNKSDDELKRDILKKNPNAAVVNPKLKQWVKEHKKELIAAGVITGAAVGYAVYSKYQDQKLDSFVLNYLENHKDADKVIDWNVANTNVVNANRANDYGGFDSGEKRFIAQWLKADIHRFDAITESEFQSMSNDDGVVLSAGEKLFRMSKSSHNTLRDGAEYVSFGEDRDRYKGFLPQMWRTNQLFGTKPKEFFESELKALGEIKAPSKKETITILESALKKKYPYLPDSKLHAEALQNFYKYQMNLIDRTNAFNKIFFEEVKARGFNSVIDWNDAGRLSDKPLILLQGSAQAQIVDITKYTHRETREIFKSIKLPSNVSDFSISDWYAEPDAVMYDMYLGLYVNA